MGELTKYRSFLANQPLLHDLPADDLDRLAARAAIRDYAAGDTVFAKGDPGTALMTVIEGRIRISSYSDDGREIVLAVFGPGEMFGEIAVIDGGERTADAVAIEPTALLVLNRRDVFPILRSNPATCIRLLEMMCERMRHTDEQIEDFNFLQLKRRLAKRLLSLCDSFGENAESGVQIGISLPQHLLASMMGTSREAVNKQLRSWEDAGLIDVRRGTITVIDRTSLERLVETSE